MNNVILGSGIVGLMAKSILPSWKVIPFARSRFFTYNPATDDNFIIQDSKIDDAVQDICQARPRVFQYKRAFDVSGMLYPNYDKNICADWLTKVFGARTPPQIQPYLNNRLAVPVYDLRANQLYASLLEKNIQEIKTEHAKGPVVEIGDHYLVRKGPGGLVREEFDNAISTIPLPALNSLVGLQQELPAKAVHFWHVQTDSLDFEGYNQTWVVDPKFSFYKVTNVGPGRYMFFCHEEVQHPGQYLMALLKDFEILDGTSIVDYITMGPSPKLDHLEAKGLYCVGSYAQWDWCMDVGSCLLRIVRYSQRGFKPFKKVL